MRAWNALAVLAAVATALLATWAAASSPADTILCNYVHPDCLSNHWLLVWVAEQVASGGSLLHNDAYYWPVGDAPWLAGNGSEGFLYLPWHLLLGWPLAANVHLVAMLALNGVAAWALARAAGAPPVAALAAAPTGAALVFALQELGAGRFTQVSVGWLGLFLAAWIGLLAAPTVRRAAVAGLLLAVTSFFYWYYGFFGVLAGAVLLVARLATREGRADPGATARALAAFAVTYLVLVGPLLAVFLANWGAVVGTGEEVFPHPEAVADATWPRVPFLVTGGRHSGAALPLTTCLFALAGLWGPRERRWVGLGLGAVAALFALLMAGPLLPHGPYETVYGLAGPLRRFWWPYRHVVGLNLALIALAARGAVALCARWPAVGFVLALSVPLQLQLQNAPWRAQFSRVEGPPTFYEGLAEAPGTLLLEPPLAPSVASSQTALVYQLYHHKRLIGGHALWVDRVRPPAWDAFVAGNSFLAELQRFERGELDGVFRFEAADLRALIDAGLGVLVVNREHFPNALNPLVDAYGEVATQLFGEPTATGRRAKAWRVDRWAGATEASFGGWTWPARVRPGGPTLAIQGLRNPSMMFSVPPPPEAPGR